MPEIVNIEDILTTVQTLCASRFNYVGSGDTVSTLVKLGKSLELRSVVKLSRKNFEAASSRTLLITIVQEKTQFDHALQWAADVREILLNNERSDLYLYIFSTNLFNNEQCINFEADERFCRKYVSRPSETIKDVFNRSFLHEYDTSIELSGFTDPVQEALGKTHLAYSWFNEDNQLQWKKALLTGKSGLDLAELLLKNPNENSEDASK